MSSLSYIYLAEIAAIHQVADEFRSAEAVNAILGVSLSSESSSNYVHPSSEVLGGSAMGIDTAVDHNSSILSFQPEEGQRQRESCEEQEKTEEDEKDEENEEDESYEGIEVDGRLVCVDVDADVDKSNIMDEQGQATLNSGSDSTQGTAPSSNGDSSSDQLVLTSVVDLSALFPVITQPSSSGEGEGGDTETIFMSDVHVLYGDNSSSRSNGCSSDNQMLVDANANDIIAKEDVDHKEP